MRAVLCTLCLLLTAPLLAADNDTSEKIAAAVADESRPQAHRDRDRNRRPARTLEFFGLRDDMRVMELLPGGGWYTRILAPVLRDNGKLYVALGTSRVKDRLLGNPGFDKVSVAEVETEFDRSGPFRTNNLTAFEFGEKNLDMVLTFRNMHNFTAEARAIINKAVFNSLKSGGLYGVVDHTQRHMAPMTNETRRRIDPVRVIKEALDSGFELVDFSDLHHKPDDELIYEVGRKTVTGNTDRFTLLFRKP
ncbi:MAG: class I SAM-dependent methyltransferase [Gammaproteobacteria bacterium]|nr:class I SAM-dependent methyltransferase [Gammaproteobacteria bacterium]